MFTTVCMNMLDMELDNDCKLKVIIVLLFFIIGYLGIMTGMIAMSLKWGFYNYNHKFDHLKELLLNNKDEHVVLVDNVKELKITENEGSNKTVIEANDENINEINE